MTTGLRTTLWILSSLAVLWTLLALVGVLGMGGMMGQGGMMGGGMMMGGMMVHMLLTWAVMLGLVGVFLYLVATARRSRVETRAL